MLKSELLAAIQREIQSHDWSHFVDEPPSVAEGGKGVVVPGCPNCRVRINTTSEIRTIWRMRCLRCWSSSQRLDARNDLKPKDHEIAVEREYFVDATP
jgi:hypothetical protein